MEGGDVTHGATLANQGFELALPASGMLSSYYVSCTVRHKIATPKQLPSVKFNQIAYGCWLFSVLGLTGRK